MEAISDYNSLAAEKDGEGQKGAQRLFFESQRTMEEGRNLYAADSDVSNLLLCTSF